MAALGTRAATGEAPGGSDKLAWEAFQRWLALGECRVVVPFAMDLAEKIPPVAVRLRRDFGMLLALVKAHALLHRSTRAADGQGRTIATLVDYAAVHGLVHKLFAEGVEATVPPTMRATVEAVQAMNRLDVSLTTLARQLKLEKSTVSARVHKAIARGFLVNNESQKGLPARIVLGDPLPEELQVLPPPEVFEGDCSGVRSESDGVSTHTAFSTYTPPRAGTDSERRPEIATQSADEAENQKDGSTKAPQAEKYDSGLYPSESHRTPEQPPSEHFPPWQDTAEGAASTESDGQHSDMEVRQRQSFGLEVPTGEESGS